MTDGAGVMTHATGPRWSVHNANVATCMWLFQATPTAASLYLDGLQTQELEEKRRRGRSERVAVGTVTWWKEGEQEEHGGVTIFQAYLRQTECRAAD